MLNFTVYPFAPRAKKKRRLQMNRPRFSRQWVKARHGFAWVLLLTSCAAWLTLSERYDCDPFAPTAQLLGWFVLASASLAAFVKLRGSCGVRIAARASFVLFLICATMNAGRFIYDPFGFFTRVGAIHVGMNIREVYQRAGEFNVVADHEYVAFVNSEMGDYRKFAAPPNYTGHLVIVPYPGTRDSCELTFKAGFVTTVNVIED